MTWTDARIAQLSRLWIEGASASAIAGELGEGVSRSAVLGKLQRLGLLKTRKAASPPRLVGACPSVAVGPAAAAFPLRRAARREPPPSPWKASAFRPLAGTVPRPWLSRRGGECAFPVAGEGAATLSCCAPCTTGRAYCVRHHAVVFRAAPPVETEAAPAAARRAA